jgi:hypothetical protein
MNARDVTTVIVDTSVETLHFLKTTINRMPRPATPAGFPAAIALAPFCAVVIAASVIPRRDLDGRLGFVLFLLTVVGLVFIASGMASTVWRLTLRLPPSFRTMERWLFTLAGFVVAWGSSPVGISLAVMGITRHEGSIGAAGLWALMSIGTGGAMVFLGVAIPALRLALHHSRPNRP